MNEEALYYKKPELWLHETVLTGIEGDASSPDLIFDSTIFYPEGGGQPCDLGLVAGIPLTHVGEEGGQVRHSLASALPPGTKLGDRLAMVLDQERRRDHSEQHSGQHLLSATLLRVIGAPTRSFHLGPETSTIDIDCPLPSEDVLEEIESRVNAFITDNYAIVTHLCPPEDIASFTLRRIPPAGEAVLRVVEIDGIDFTPCCGTHLSSTGELHLLLILGAEKYKGLTRLSFLAGARALGHGRLCARAAMDAGRVLGTGPDGLGVEAARVAARLKKSQTELRGLLRDRAVLEAREALAGLAGVKGPILLKRRGRGTDAAAEGAKAISELGGLGLVVSLDELTVCAAGPAAYPAPGVGLDLPALLGPAAAALGGKGGGRGAFFRATFPGEPELDEFLAKSMKILQN